MKLSIIIPCYNAEPYIDELLKALHPQLNDEVEVIVIDDGSDFPFLSPVTGIKVIRQENGGASVARNRGLDEAQGEYVAFIDSDDLVPNYYIKRIFKELESDPDYIYMSWESFGGWNQRILLKSIDDEFPPYNLCVWNRIYRRSLIGKTRFNKKKLIAEDAEFIRKVVTKGKKKAFIPEIMYKYRSNTPNSLTKRFADGRLNTSRIVYYFNRVEPNRTDLIEEFKKLDKSAEVILLTNHNAIPELANYAMIMAPCRVKATEKRGEPTNLIEIVEKPIKTQVVIWTKETFEIGGIETFNFQLCKLLSPYYNIIVLYDRMDAKQIARIIPYAECRKNTKRTVECDVLIVNRIIDTVPDNIKAKTTIQMVHGVKHSNYHVPQDKDIIVSVSEAVKESFGHETEKSVVIRNMLDIEKPENEPLLIVSTTRTDCADKGADRMVKLSNLMDRQGVKYIWLCFTNAKLPANASKNMIKMEPTLDITSWIAKADYICQLSDHEAFCYSIAEALCLNTPIIATPLTVLSEFSYEEGVHGYTVPFDITDDYDTTQFLNIPKFDYTFDNKESIKRWRKLLGNKKPDVKYVPPKTVRIMAIKKYFDTELQIDVLPGNEYDVLPERAAQIINAGYAKEV